MSFAAKSPYNLRLTHLLRVVILISQCMVPYEHIQKFGQNIINLFLACHPRPIDLCIPPKNLKVMLAQVRDKMNTFHAMSGVACLFSPDSDAKIIFAALDADGDGLVSEHEFFTWVLRGVAGKCTPPPNSCKERERQSRLICCYSLGVVCCLLPLLSPVKIPLLTKKIRAL